MLEKDAVHIGCEADPAGRGGQAAPRKGTAWHQSGGSCDVHKHLDRHGPQKVGFDTD